MRNEARTADIDLNVVSAFRDFNRQAAIWNANLTLRGAAAARR